MYTLTQSGCITDGNGTTIPPENNGTDAWVAYQEWLDAGNTPLPYIAPIIEPSQELLQFRREYLDTTAQLCALAGEAYTGKLTNVDFKRISIKASSNTLTGILVASMVYLRTVLRELDGENWFENIEGL